MRRFRHFALCACLILAGCTVGGDSSDNSRRHGFYGSVSGGLSGP